MAKDTNIEQIITKAVADTKKHFDAKTGELKDEMAEVKRHFDVVAESLRSEIAQVAEGVAANAERLDRLDSMEATLETVQNDVEAIKVTLQIMKHELKRKVDYDEFATLEQRVSALEAKTQD